MNLIELFTLLVVAGLSGALGQAIAGYSRGGCLVSIALGFIGALIGRWLVMALFLPPVFTLDVGGTEFPIIWSILGAAIFVAATGWMSRGARR